MVAAAGFALAESSPALPLEVKFCFPVDKVVMPVVLFDPDLSPVPDELFAVEKGRRQSYGRK